MKVSKKLILRCREGNNAAYQELYGITIKYVFAIVSSYISNSEKAKDVIQEIYTAVFISLKSYEAELGDFKFWLRRICINKCVDDYRKNKNHTKIVGVENVISLHPFETPNYGNLTREDIIKMLFKMPSVYRNIFLLVEIDEYSHKEVGELLGISTVNSRTQLHRAKKWLKKNISNEDLKKYGIQTF